MDNSRKSSFLDAMQIVETRGIWWSEWQDVRDLVFERQSAKAIARLMRDFELNENDAEVLVSWVSSALKGPKVDLVEISVADLPFIRSKVIDADEVPPKNPYEMPKYLARRGVFIDAATPFEVEDGNQVIRGVIFQGKSIEPEMLDQVWEVRSI